MAGGHHPHRPARCWRAPEWLYHGNLAGKDRAEELGRIRTAVLASLAGTIALGSAFISHRSTDIAQRTLELNRQGQVTERFTRAVDQLGNQESAGHAARRHLRA